MNSKNHINYLCLFLIVTSAACNKNAHEPDSDGTVLSKVVYYSYLTSPGGKNDTSTSYFSYNSGGQLISETFFSKSSQDTTVFVYNAQNQLTETQESSSAVGVIARYRYLYDAAGRVSRKTGTPVLANLGIDDHTYAYDAANHVVADSIHNGSTDEVISVTVYTYDAEDIGTATLYNKINGNLTLDTIVTSYYDSRMNPYYANRLVFYFAHDDAETLSANNLLPPLGSGDYYSTYEYYSNGLLRSAINKKTKDGDHFVTNYFYTR